MGDIPQRVSDTGILTTINLAIIAVLMVLVVAGILYGMKLKRARAEADRIEQERVEAEGGHVPSRREAAQPLSDTALDRAATQTAPPFAPEAPPAPPPVVEDVPAAVTPDEPPQPDVAIDEPIPAAAPLDASPASEAEPAPAPAPTPAPALSASLADAPVGRIKGIGPKVASLLAARDIATVGDIAALDARAAEDLDAHLGPFTGRMGRDRWLEQARLLAAGDVATYEARFGKL